MIEPAQVFMSRHAPFSGLPRHLVEEAGRRVVIRHLPERETLRFQDPENAGYVFFLTSGRLDLVRESGRFACVLPGELAGFARFTGTALAAHEAVAARDSVLYALPADLFATLAADPGFAAFLEDQAGRLGLAVELAEKAEAAARMDPFMRLAIGAVDLPPLVLIDERASLAEAARAMAAAKSSACLATRESATVGILTERDIVRAVAEGAGDPGSFPVSRFMTPSIITIAQDELLFEAFARMVKHGIRRLAVTGPDGAVKGLIGERDLLAVHGENPVHLSGEIGQAASALELARVFSKLTALALKATAEGVGVRIVGRLISEMHDQIMVRAAQLVDDEVSLSVPFAVAALGSQGRKEQYLATDQDNALILADAPGAESEGARFAGLFADALLAIGFPACPNRVMVDNPAWRRTQRGWESFVRELILAATPEAVLTIALLADARHVFGDPALTHSLLDTLYARVADAPVILRYMAREALRFSPPIGFFGNFTLEKTGDGGGVLDIKKGGVFPLVLGIKTLCLSHGIREVSTLGRLEELINREVLSRTLGARIKDGYEYMQTLRVAAQAEAVRRGKVPDNRLDPGRLTPPQRDRLKEAFKTVVDFQTLLHGIYALRLMT